MPLNTEGVVIAIGTVLEILSPGRRTGWAVTGVGIVRRKALQKVDGGSSPLTETRCRWHMDQQDEALNRGSVKSNAPVSRYDGRCARGGNSGRQGAASRRQVFFGLNCQRAFRRRNLSNAESRGVSKSAQVVSAFRFRSWGFPALCIQLCGCRRHPRRRPPIGQGLSRGGRIGASLLHYPVRRTFECGGLLTTALEREHWMTNERLRSIVSIRTIILEAVHDR